MIYSVVGTASGEELYISENEKVKLLETVSKSLVGNKISAAGIDNPSVKETLRLAERYARSGASLLRIRFPRTEEVIVNYFSEVLKHSPLPCFINASRSAVKLWCCTQASSKS